MTYDDIIRRLTLADDEGVYSDEEEGEWETDEEEMDEQTRLLMEFLAKKAEEEKDFVIDYDTVLADLEMVLPSIPDKYNIEPINPPPFKIKRELYGRWMPKEKEDKKKKKAKKPKKAP